MITQVVSDACQRQQPVTLRLKMVNQNNLVWPDLTTLIHGYNANDNMVDWYHYKKYEMWHLKRRRSYQSLALRLLLLTQPCNPIF